MRMYLSTAEFLNDFWLNQYSKYEITDKYAWKMIAKIAFFFKVKKKLYLSCKLWLDYSLLEMLCSHYM